VSARAGLDAFPALNSVGESTNLLGSMRRATTSTTFLISRVTELR
jgi:hypothetical protein